MTCQHVQGKKKRISNAPGSVAYFDLSFAHGRAVGNTKAWPPGNYRPEVDACLDSVLGQKPNDPEPRVWEEEEDGVLFSHLPSNDLDAIPTQRAGTARRRLSTLETYEAVLLPEL